MRVSQDVFTGAGQPVLLKKDHRLSSWFWDREIGFCQRHVDRDRQRQVDSYLRSEQELGRARPSGAAVTEPQALTP
jgi:hypothetical protein